MIKILSIFTSVLLVFIMSYFYEDEKVTIEPSVPSLVKPGDEFTVELTITKGIVQGFASLQQSLPEGFTATAIESGHAAFVFEDHYVKFYWMELPKEKSFVISYKVKTDSTCKGLKTMNGIFSYIENDLAKRISLIPSVIMLSDDASLATDASRTADAPSAELNPAEPNKETVAEKLIAPLPGKKDEYNIALKITKDLRQHAARIFDQAPAGYTAEMIEGHGAKFSIVNGLVEFYWETLPKDSVFTVSYHIFRNRNTPVVNSNTNLQAEDNHEHEVETCDPVYTFHDASVATEKAQTAGNVPALPKTQPQQPVYADAPAPPVAQTSQPEDTDVPSTQKTLAKEPVHASVQAPAKTQTQQPLHREVPPARKSQEKPLVHSNIPVPPKTQTRQPVLADVPSPRKTPAKQFAYANVPTQARQTVYAWIPVPHHGQLLVCVNLPAPAPQKGIYYKVQIAAIKGTSDRKADLFISQYHISESMDIVMHDGWKKYLVGMFTKFSEANRYKTETQAKIPDAFVVAFNNDERIPLHEALKPKKRINKI